MNDRQAFRIVGRREPESRPLPRPHGARRFPWVSAAVLAVLLLGFALADVIAPRDPSYLDLNHCNLAPCRDFLFGTDSLGRDLFSCIWYGGRISVAIGLLATAISTAVAMVYGTLSGLASDRFDHLLMRLTELLLSVPSLLLILFLQAIFGKPSVLSISLVIGLSSWCSIAKLIRTEVRQLRTSGYVVASKAMGGSFFYLLRRHLAPNFLPSVTFMVVMNIRSAMIDESTLSFLGMGLPLDTVSWGSLLSQADKALTSGAWWLIVIPGLFLVTLLLCITNLGNWLRTAAGPKESNL